MRWFLYRQTKAVIHLEHLTHNVRELKLLNGSSSFFCPMVKANAYGHGDLEIAKHLEGIGIQTMGVSLIEEGILLREAGILSEILVFGIFDQEGAQAIVRHRLTPVLSIWSQIHR